MTSSARMSDRQVVLAAFDALDAACEGDDADAIIDLFVDDADATFWARASTSKPLVLTRRGA
jgi:hypothetical protein